MSWLETYRGTVFRWEIDNTDHFTVAYYFQRLTDATLTLLDDLGLAPQVVPTAHVYVSYQHELRVGDIMHIASGVVYAAEDALVLGHKLFESTTGTLCSTFEQRMRVTAPLTLATRRLAEVRHVDWDGPRREQRPQPRGLEGFVDSARDTVKPWEIDVTGGMSLSHHIHRFSAANAHATAALGMTPAFYKEQRRGFSTFEFQLAVEAPLRAGDLVVVKSAPLHVGTSSVRMFHQMLDARTGQGVAALDQLGVSLDLDARRPAPLPDDIRARAKALVAPTM